MNGGKAGEKLKVFIVDDHEVVRLGIAQFLNSKDNITVCGQAGDANTAVTLISDCSPDIVIVDLNLGTGAGGIDLIKALKGRYRGMPVIVLSMHGESEIVKRALKAGANGYVLKSEPVEQIVEAVGRVHNGGTYVSGPLKDRLLDIMIIRDSGSVDLVSLLTDREFEIFRLIGRGLDRREIAERVGINTSTIGTYRDRIKAKLNLKSSGELTTFAARWVSENSKD